MPLTINHQFVSGKADSDDVTVIRPSNWNDSHTVAGFLPDGLDSFTPLTGQATSDLVESDTITLATTANSGAASDRVFALCVRGDGNPQIQVNSLAWSDYATARSGDTIKLRLTTSGSPSTTSNASLYIDGFSTEWSVETAP